MVRGSKKITKTSNGSKVSAKDSTKDSSSDTSSDEEKIDTKSKNKLLLKKTNTSNPNRSDDVIFESSVDGIIITNKCRFWIYVIMNNQWDIILKNIDNNMMYIGAYTGKSIAANDIVLFYMKADKGKSSGFVAIGQIGSDMEKNMEGIKVFTDKNLNRYITEINSLSIFGSPCRIGEFNDLIINASDSKIKGSTRFAMMLLKGECTFAEITIKKLGIELVKKMFEIKNNIVEEIEDEQTNETDNDSQIEIDDKKTESSSRKSKKTSTHSSAKQTVKLSTKPVTKPTTSKPVTKKPTKQSQKVTSDSDTEIESDESDDKKITSKKVVSKKTKTSKDTPETKKQIIVKGKNKGQEKKIIRQKKFSDNEESDISDDSDAGSDDDPDESDDDNNGIEGNIPVMFIICPKLRKVLSKLHEPLNKVKSVLDHYKFCNTCDITNNNSREIYMTLNRIDQSTIKFMNNGYTNALNAYLSMEPFPKYVGTEYIKMYHMLDSEHYQGDVLIEYTSNIEPIIDLIENEQVLVKHNTKQNISTARQTKKNK